MQLKTQKQSLKDPIRIVRFCEKISKVSIYLLIFLLPLWFLPWTINTLDFNKQVLLGILVFVAFICWLIKTLVGAKLEFNPTLLNIPVIILIFVYTAATIFSLSRYGSFWGLPLDVSSALLTLIGFVLLYFLIANIFFRKDYNPPLAGSRLRRAPEIFWLLFALVSSGFFAALFGGFQLFGKFFLPWDFTKIISFNTIGTVNSLGLFLAFLLPLTIVLMFMAKRLIFWFLGICALVFLIELIFINFWAAWLVLIVGSSFFLIFSMLNLEKAGKINLIFLPMALLIIGLFFVIFKISLPGFPPSPIEIFPTWRAEFNIAKSILKESPALGTGPGTFVYDYSKFKSPDLNQTAFWNVRFGKGAAEILDKLITTGILGILSIFALFLMFFWLGFKYLKEKASIAEKKTEWLLGIGVFSGLSGVILSQFLYPANFSLMFVFWVLLASFGAISQGETKSRVLKPSSPQVLSLSFILVLILIFGLGLIFIGAQKYLAEVRYTQGLKAWQEGQTELAINKLSQAVNLNPNLDSYRRDISQFYLIKINETLQKRGLTPEEITSQTQFFIKNSINSAKRAVELNPADVANWSVAGFTYRNIIGLVLGVEDWALNFYQKATELEPTNPYIFTEIGKVYLAKSDLFLQQKRDAESSENLRLALENFEKSLGLKNDYAPAHFQIAMIYIREGKIKEAIDKLEALKQSAPSDTGLAFQLGIIYYNDNQFDKAKRELERAVRLDENYSNARYFLGLVYDKEGNKQEAILQFEKIERLNPDNEEVKKILSNLKTGKPTLEGILPGLPPIEEKPPERLEK